MNALFWLLLIVVAIVVLGGAVFTIGWFVLWYALVGLVIGGIARLLVRNTARLGFGRTILAGLVGSFAGGWIADAAELGDVLQFVVAVLVAAVVVAIASGSVAAAKE